MNTQNHRVFKSSCGSREFGGCTDCISTNSQYFWTLCNIEQALDYWWEALGSIIGLVTVSVWSEASHFPFGGFSFHIWKMREWEYLSAQRKYEQTHTELLQKKKIRKQNSTHINCRNFPPETIMEQNKMVGQHSKWNLIICPLNNNNSNPKKKMAKMYQ